MKFFIINFIKEVVYYGIDIHKLLISLMNYNEDTNSSVILEKRVLESQYFFELFDIFDELSYKHFLAVFDNSLIYDDINEIKQKLLHIPACHNEVGFF